MPFWPFRRSRAAADAGALLTAVQAASRRPALFGEGRVPDTLDGRFELMALHGALALIRLRAEPGAGKLAQAFTDKLFRHFDAGLREDGVGDLTIPKRMRKLAGAFYGRLEAYEGPIAQGDAAALEAALARNVPGVEGQPFAAALARYASHVAAFQASAPAAALHAPEGWPVLGA